MSFENLLSLEDPSLLSFVTTMQIVSVAFILINEIGKAEYAKMPMVYYSCYLRLSAASFC